ncbi:hypothetical protein EYF80_049936 [Liparis tanakae]|uniref:Uncharacterized protein n=1 Tax=Liparis tanakae TaxID=230148 RepID=A0A4Z2FFG6_9TELE|nr:hypothetical protein EYF80_049936 [Liparis tanakae]
MAVSGMFACLCEQRRRNRGPFLSSSRCLDGNAVLGNKQVVHKGTPSPPALRTLDDCGGRGGTKCDASVALWTPRSLEPPRRLAAALINFFWPLRQKKLTLIPLSASPCKVAPSRGSAYISNPLAERRTSRRGLVISTETAS